MGFEFPWGPIGVLLEKALAGVIAKTVADVALSMKLYYERGEPTTAADLKTCKKALNRRRDS